MTYELLSKHVLFLGGIGSGKTTAMKHLIRQLRINRPADDVFVIFDTKGDFRRDFYQPGDAVISSNPGEDQGGVVWNLFRDLLGEAAPAGRGHLRDRDHDLQRRARRRPARTCSSPPPPGTSSRPSCRSWPTGSGRASNEHLRETLEQSGGVAQAPGADKRPGRDGPVSRGRAPAESILAFLQLTLRKSFSGVFRRGGDFSVRDFIRQQGGRALFIEYDIANGSACSRLPGPDGHGDQGSAGLGRPDAGRTVRENCYFVLDEFALLPRLAHISDGINFGRELGLKFLVATQNVNQVWHGYQVSSARAS